MISILKQKLTSHDMHSTGIEGAREYIRDYWKKLERYHPEDDRTLVGLPHPYLVPSFDENASFNFNEQYYWDSYFMVQGMLNTENREFVAGILDNLLKLMQRFHVIPNASRTYFTGRSQPPILTSFIFNVYDLGGFDKKWLSKSMSVAQDEYWNVWMSDKHPNWRQVYQGLSRYYDINVLHDLAEAESGWDMTTRFGRRCLNYLPVDLNSLLYKYETDFVRSAQIAGDSLEAEKWQSRADIRRETMQQLMWDRMRHFYYDYNYKKQKIGRVSSLAGFYPMWAGLATNEEAAQMVRTIKRFEHKGGLAATDGALPSLRSMPVQWAYPNGWAPLHFMVVEGLKRYGYDSDAKRIAQKWVHTNLSWYESHHEFVEKYNVVQINKPPHEGLYPSQTGFGWTNAIFERFCQDWL